MFLNPKDASAHLAAKGIVRSPKTLAKLRCVGGGPKFRKLGRSVVYEDNSLDDWVEDLLSDEYSSTSEISSAFGPGS